MMAGTVETAGEGESDSERLRGSSMNAPTQGVLGDTMAHQRSNRAAIEQKERLPISRSAIESSERPTAVVGQSLSGKSRNKGL